jgi:AraC-like DNA-binding protein
MPQDYCQRGSHTYYLRFTGTAADELIELAGLKGVYSYQLEKEEPRIRRLIEKIFSSTALNKNETEAETIANLTLFLAELGRIVQKKNNVSHADDRIAQILPLMNYRFAREIDLDQYAQAINLSRSRFSHLFKQTMGCSPHTYILDLRLEHAAEFLLSTDDPISQISYAVGFTDPFYFSRLFKKKFGISPKNFREQ